MPRPSGDTTQEVYGGVKSEMPAWLDPRERALSLDL